MNTENESAKDNVAIVSDAKLVTAIKTEAQAALKAISGTWSALMTAVLVSGVTDYRVWDASKNEAFESIAESDRDIALGSLRSYLSTIRKSIQLGVQKAWKAPDGKGKSGTSYATARKLMEEGENKRIDKIVEENVNRAAKGEKLQNVPKRPGETRKRAARPPNGGNAPEGTGQAETVGIDATDVLKQAEAFEEMKVQHARVTSYSLALETARAAYGLETSDIVAFVAYDAPRLGNRVKQWLIIREELAARDAADASDAKPNSEPKSATG